MKEKPPTRLINKEFAERERRKKIMSDSQAFIAAVHARYSEKDSCFYLDESTKDLFEREVLSELYGPGYIGWMNQTEDKFLRKYIYEVYKDWQVEDSRKQKINYDHPDKNERL